MDALQNNWRKWIKILLAMVLLVGAAGWGYHWASPKVELQNLSTQSFSEFILQLPDSRVSIGPEGPGSFARVYFSPQSQDGTLHYSLSSSGEVIAAGEHPFSAEGQFFRKIKVVIQPDGRIEFDIRS